MNTFTEFERICALLRYSDIDPKQDITFTLPREAFDVVLRDAESKGVRPHVTTRLVMTDNQDPFRGRTITLTY